MQTAVGIVRHSLADRIPADAVERRVRRALPAITLEELAAAFVQRSYGPRQTSSGNFVDANDAPQTMKSRLGRPATLGSAAAAHLQLMVWCKNCRHRAEPDPAEMAERCGAETTVRDWGQRLVCGHVVRSTPPSSNDASTPIEYETISLGSSRARNY